MGSQNFSDLSEESVQFLRNAGMTDEQIGAIGLRLRGVPASGQAATQTLERPTTEQLGELERQGRLFAPDGRPLQPLTPEFIQQRGRQGVVPNIPQRVGQDQRVRAIAALAPPALEAFQRFITEPTTGALSFAGQAAPMTPPAFGRLIRESDLNRNVVEQFRANQNPVSAFGEAFRQTDFPTTEVSLPFRVPLPGGRSLQDVDVGVKGALEATLGDAPFAIGGAAIAGVRGGLRQAARQTGRQATRKALRSGIEQDVGKLIDPLSPISLDPSVARRDFLRQRPAIAEGDVGRLIDQSPAIRPPLPRQVVERDVAAVTGDRIAPGLSPSIGSRTGVTREVIAARQLALRGGDVPTAQATRNVVADQAEQAVEQSVRSASDVLPDTPIQQQAGSLRNPNLDIPQIETPTPLIDRQVTPSPAVKRIFKEPQFPEGTVIDSSGRAILPAPSPAAQGVVREAVDARATLMGITPRTLNRMTQRQPLPQPSVSNAPASAAGRMAAEDSDGIISWFGNLISSPDSVASTELTAILRSRELGRRASAVQSRAKELVDSGVSAQEAIREATGELSGELPRASTGLDTMISEEIKTALYSRIYRELHDEPFEMASTATALANALRGIPIPRDPGTAGGSAFSRLARVFPPEILRGLDSKESIDALILRGKAPPEGARGFRAPLGGVLDNPSQPKLFEIPYESRQLPRDPRTAAQREIDLQVFEASILIPEAKAPLVSPRTIDIPSPQFGPSQQVGFSQLEDVAPIGPRPFEVIDGEVVPLGGVQQPVSPRRFPDDVRTPIERQLDTEAFAAEIAPKPDPSLGKAPPLEPIDKVVVEQLRQVPPDKMERIMSEVKFLGLQGLDAANFIRSNLASFDLSWLRQQALLIPGNPIKFGEAFYDSLRSVWSEEYAANVMKSIQSDELFKLYDQSGADFLRPLGGEVASRWEAAEDFVNLSRIKGETRPRPFQTLSEKLPWIRIAGRAHVVGTNSMNWRIYKSYYKELMDMNEQIGKGFIKLKPGEEFDVAGELAKSANFLADMSGRGPLPEGLRQYTPALNAAFFSVRLNIGRLIAPHHLGSRSRFVRRKALKNWLAAVGTYSSFIWAGERMGLWEVEADPRSSDFMSIRIAGRTRIDVWGGMKQYITLYGRLLPTVANGEWGPRLKSTTTGGTRPLDPGEQIARFARSKAAPAAGRVWELWAGTDFKGAEIDRTNMLRQVKEIGLPIMGQDIYEAFDAHGLTGLPLGVLSAIGAGVAVHELPRWPDLDEYYQFSQNNDPQKAEALRRQFRRQGDNEARLFIRGKFTALQNPASRGRVLELMRELGLSPDDVPGYANVFGSVAPR